MLTQKEIVRLEGHGGGYGMSRPEIMHKWEFDYLVAHPEFAAVWLRQGRPGT